MVKKGNQTENLYIGESEFPFEPFHFSCILPSWWAREAPQIISSSKEVITELWSSHSTSSHPINNKPSAGWTPHSWRTSLEKGECREKGTRTQEQAAWLQKPLSTLTDSLSSLCAVDLHHFLILLFPMEPRIFLCSRLSVLYYGQLPIKSCLDILSQKRKRKKKPLGGNFVFLDDSVESETFPWRWIFSPQN